MPHFSNEIIPNKNKDGKDIILNLDMWTGIFLKLQIVVHIFLKNYSKTFTLFKTRLYKNSI